MPTIELSPALYGANASSRRDARTSARVAIPAAAINGRQLLLPGQADNGGFVLPLPLSALADPSVAILAGYEIGFAGYEAPTRALFRRHLQADDLFVDIGAHWGTFALDLVTSIEGLRAIAIEAAAPNQQQLANAIRANDLGSRITVVPSAAGARRGELMLTPGVSMTHHISAAASPGRPQFRVPVVPVDAVMQDVTLAPGARVALKIDVEGQELAVLEGAQQLLASGRVALIAWEYHDRYHGTDAAQAIRDLLAAAGFALYRFPHHHWGGALVPFVPGPGVCNVVALPPGTPPAVSYGPMQGNFPPLPPPYYGELDEATHCAGTRALRATPGSEVLRWIDQGPPDGRVQERAKLAAEWIEAGAQVVDLGSGTGVMGAYLKDNTVLAVDLLPFTPTTQCRDLERDGVPAAAGGRWDVVLALDLLPYLSDPAALLRSAQQHGRKLIVSYPVGAPDDSRIAAGWRQDWEVDQWRAVLVAAGWQVTAQASLGNEVLYRCEAATG